MTIIDQFQAVLRQQFLHGEGMQSVLYAVKPEFQISSNNQTHPNDRGLHCSVVARPEILRAMFAPFRFFRGPFEFLRTIYYHQ